MLESLRAPLEDGLVTIARSAGAVRYPCRFSLVAAMNPCPCGFLGDPTRACRCGEVQLAAYANKLSGPLLDRFDMQISVARVGRSEILGSPEGDGSTVIRGRVETCRSIQTSRYGSPLMTNGSAPRNLFTSRCRLEPDARLALGNAIDGAGLSGRGVNRVMRVARTIADLEGADAVVEEHVAEALMLRVVTLKEVAGCA